jgi:hypothetical protein
MDQHSFGIRYLSSDHFGEDFFFNNPHPDPHNNLKLLLILKEDPRLLEINDLRIKH